MLLSMQLWVWGYTLTEHTLDTSMWKILGWVMNTDLFFDSTYSSRGGKLTPPMYVKHVPDCNMIISPWQGGYPFTRNPSADTTDAFGQGIFLLCITWVPHHLLRKVPDR